MKRKPINWFLIGMMGCVGVAIGSYYWATSLMNSVQAYRSPLAINHPLPGKPIGNPITEQVVIVLIDSLRLDTSLDAAVMPTLNRLRAEGASAIMHSQAPSFSAPGWATILTGAWPEINDSQLFNPPNEHSIRPFTQDNIFAAAKRSNLNTALAGYIWFEKMLEKSEINAGFHTPGEDASADKEVIEALLPWIDENYQLILIHLDQVDYAGHYEGGPKDDNWELAANRADTLLGKILAHMDLSKETIVILSDHGQIDRGGHGGTDPITLIEPFVLAGAGVIPGTYPDIQMVDVAPTISVLLGINLPASNQGRVLVNMLTLTPSSQEDIQNADLLQKKELLQSYEAAIDRHVYPRPKDDPASILAAMQDSRDIRLSSERIWRNVFVAFILFTPPYFLFVRKEKKALPLLIGALVYLVLFNFRYAILDRRTYSIASVDSETWLITYIASTTALALLIGWIIPIFSLRIFRQQPRQAAGTTLGYIWVTIFLTSLPALLGYAINGATVTWTTPDFRISFLGLLSIIQCLFVAGFGLLLIAISAIMSKVYTSRFIH